MKNTNIITTTNTTNNTKGVTTMKKTSRIKTRIIAGILSVVTIFSVGAMSMASASAKSLDTKEITKDLTEFGVEKIIDATVGGGICGELLNKGAGYILGMAFDEDEPGIADVLKKLDELSGKIDDYHKEEMNHLKLINSNIDSKDFRKEADSIADDYRAAIKKIEQYSNNITTPGEGLIDNTTYRTYKKILGESTCNIAALEKNFNVMVEYVKGTRSSTDHVSGYRLTSEYLMDKILATYKETKHDWQQSPDFLEYLNTINGEIEIMESNVALDYLTILSLNNMAYKVKEYEITNNIYQVNENESPYSYYENFAKDLTNSLESINGIYKAVINENNENDGFMQATAEIPSFGGYKTVKGFHTFSEAWAQCYKVSQTYTIKLRGDVVADSKNGFNFDKLDSNTYQFRGNGGFHIDKDRNVTIDLGNHTLDATAKSDLIFFPMHSNSTLNLSNGTLLGGKYGIHSDERNNVTLNLTNVKIKNTKQGSIWFGNNSNANHKLTMNSCTFDHAGNVYTDAKNATVNVKNSTFTWNETKGSGGSFYLPNTDNAAFENCAFTENHAKNGIGGAISAHGVTVKNCTFMGNSAERNSKGGGGAIAANELKLYNSTFKYNHTDDQAGAVYGISGYHYTQIIDGCTFEGNLAKNVGGAVRYDYLDGNNRVIRNSIFTNNRADRGPAILVQSLNGHSKDLADNWSNYGSNNNATYKGYIDPRYCVPDFAWGISGGSK